MPNNTNAIAAAIDENLRGDIQALQDYPLEGSRSLPVIKDLSPDCTTTGNLESRLQEISLVLANSGRVYRRGNSIVLEVRIGQEIWLASLLMDGKVEPGASQRLANIFQCEYLSGGKNRRFPPTSHIVSNVLLREPTLEMLPEIKLYSRRPLYDTANRLCGPGFHQASGILVHGPDVDVGLPRKGTPDLALPALQRLPKHLRCLLEGFCFKTDADLGNTVGVLVTGMMMPQFITSNHPLVLLNGNQAGVGKTLLARTIGMVMDGRDPGLLSYKTNDEELGKELLAKLRDSDQSCMVFDNAKLPVKVALSSPVIETFSSAPKITLRILGSSVLFERVNDLLWFLTMNDTRSQSDMMRRFLPIMLEHAGDPATRTFKQNPIDYAQEHRVEILAELVAMVEQWKQQGCCLSSRPHSMKQWASTIGGVLEANGLPEFLANFGEAAEAFDTLRDELAALAEQVIKASKGLMFKEGALCDSDEALKAHIVAHGGPPAKFKEVFRQAKVLEVDLQEAKSEKRTGRVISGFLSKILGRQIRVRNKDREYTAVLRRADGRSNQSLYSFQVVEDPEVSETAKEVAEGAEPGSPPEASARTRVQPPRITGPQKMPDSDGGKDASAPSQPSASPPLSTNNEGTPGNNEDWD